MRDDQFVLVMKFEKNTNPAVIEVIPCRNVSRETIAMKEIIPAKAYRNIVFDSFHEKLIIDNIYLYVLNYRYRRE
jgi:hypothetical protein